MPQRLKSNFQKKLILVLQTILQPLIHTLFIALFFPFLDLCATLDKKWLGRYWVAMQTCSSKNCFTISKISCNIFRGKVQCCVRNMEKISIEIIFTCKIVGNIEGRYFFKNRNIYTWGGDETLGHHILYKVWSNHEYVICVWLVLMLGEALCYKIRKKCN